MLRYKRAKLGPYHDLDLEHCTKMFKGETHSHRGVFTGKVISRVSRSALKTDSVIKQYDIASKVVHPFGKHTTADIMTHVQQCNERKLFQHIPNRKHSRRTSDVFTEHVQVKRLAFTKYENDCYQY